ncbi:multicopper oxidase [Micromonospora sp. WMMD882]|uniref:multicopper oxidase family protein n=1 Tax=Micromonospora sp. WMMD882 TaxID=3015151 RepID=UPI00248B54E9|nr:multicopper oxidase [Micromonospora sp. WMMD882]WBB77867.1 multicopper oxidase [Micromonospora sp. WMMD882]
MTTRRRLLLGGAAAFAAGSVTGAATGSAAHPATTDPDPAAGGSRRRREGSGLDPTGIPRYVTPLAVPPVMPPTASGPALDRYLIGVRQFRQRILPPGFPATTVWGYGALNQPATFGFPAATIEARVGRPVRVTWVNDLVDGYGRYRPHLLAVDPTLHWANPPGGVTGRDSRPTFSSTPGPYRGPVPIVTHLHGGHTRQESDGYPEAWYLPVARNIPAGYARVGTFHDRFRAGFAARYGVRWPAGTAVFQYDNDQRPTTEWYHDHVLGLTRLNVYAGLAGFYLLRGGVDLPPGVLPGPAPTLGEPPGTRHHEIPLAIQDRSFDRDGSLFYPTNRSFFDDAGPYLPDGPFPPIWNPEFFGDTMLVNGRTWPSLTVEPRRYRFRLLNGCNSRFLLLAVAADPLAARPVRAALPFWQIGNDGGFLTRPVRLDRVLLGPAERADVIVDFTGLPEGTRLYLVNEGPDGPFTGGDQAPAEPTTTGQVLRFVVGARRGPDRSVPPERLTLPAVAPLGPASVVRRLALGEETSGDQPVELLLGTVDAAGNPTLLPWHAPVTERPTLGATEIWEFHNPTEDAHPVHLHQSTFEVLGRGVDGARPPGPGELGRKDTVLAYPGDVTRLRVRFDLPGRYVWHCHILEHEDNEMMRPFQVG